MTFTFKDSEVISIHAPANGATSTGSIAYKSFLISIHAPANGATDDGIVGYNIYQFQSTLRRTERRYPVDVLTDTPWYFNPRSGERSDCNFAQKNLKNYTKPLNNIIVFYN